MAILEPQPLDNMKLLLKQLGSLERFWLCVCGSQGFLVLSWSAVFPAFHTHLFPVIHALWKSEDGDREEYCVHFFTLSLSLWERHHR